MTTKIREGYKQTEVGVIPEDWEVKYISEYSTRITDGEHLTPIRTESGYYLLSARNIMNGRIAVTDVDYVGESEYLRIRKRCNPEFGDVLISCSGSIGRVSTVPENFECVMVRSAALVKPNYSKTTGLYIQYYLQSSSGQNQIFASMNQGAQPNLFLNHIQCLRIAFPPTKSEQTEITIALSDTDALITSLEKLIEKKRAIKQGAMHELLKPKEGWEVKKFKDKDVTELITCGIAATPIYVDESVGYPFLSSTNVKDGKVVWNNYKHISKDLHSLLYRNNPPVKGDLLYSRVGTIGEAAIVDVDFEFSVYVSLTLIKTGKLLNNEFLKHLLNSKKYKALAQREVLMGGGVGNLNVNVVREFDIPIPKYEEQTRIATILSDIDAEISVLDQKLGKYKMIKQGMMQELLTGKIRLVENV